MRLTQIVEALLFASDAPLTAADIARVDERLDEDTVDAVVQELRSGYDEAERAFQIYEVAGGYQLLTRPDFATYLERYETIPQPAKLSASGLEVLAIIAYRQPIGRGEVEEIRGVGSSGSIKTLLDRGLVEVAGRGEGLGRPLLYGTTQKFLEHFGFKSLEDLPRPDELPVVLRAEGAKRGTEEDADAEKAGAEDAETKAEDAEIAAGAEDAESIKGEDASAEHTGAEDAEGGEGEGAEGVGQETGASAELAVSVEVGDAPEDVAADDAGGDAPGDVIGDAGEPDHVMTAVESEPAEIDAVAQAGTEEEI